MGCVSFMMSQSWFLVFWGGLNFYQIFFKFLSECKAMSGIPFEADPLIFSVSGWCHLDANLDFRHYKSKICSLECRWPPDQNFKIFFFVQRITLGLATICFFSKNLFKKTKWTHLFESLWPPEQESYGDFFHLTIHYRSSHHFVFSQNWSKWIQKVLLTKL